MDGSIFCGYCKKAIIKHNKKVLKGGLLNDTLVAGIKKNRGRPLHLSDLPEES